MSDGFQVDPAQLRRHAAHLDAVRARFAAVQGASASIGQDSAAYGMLCGWIAAILESQHRGQDELYSYVAENLALAAESLAAVSSAYEASDDAAAHRIRRSAEVAS